MGVLSWEKVLFRGYKTLCVTSEGLLALLLILPRSCCGARNAKHIIIPSVVSVNFFFLFPELVCCVRLSC